MNSAQNRTLWVWESLPKDLSSQSQDQGWLNDGDALENVHRLSMGNQFNFFVIFWEATHFNPFVKISLRKLAYPGIFEDFYDAKGATQVRMIFFWSEDQFIL